VHENNNKAWSLLKPGLSVSTSNDKEIRDIASAGRHNRVRVFPNPMKDQAVFSYELKAGSQVEISLFDLQGRSIRTLLKEYTPAGPKTQAFDISDLDKGVYIYFFNPGDHSESGKMVVVN